MADITLAAQKRDVIGKQVKKLRNDGQTPGVIHERGKDSVHVSVPSLDFKKAFSAAGKHHAIKLDVGGKKYTTIIKEVVNAPASSTVLHAVFQAIKEDEKVTAEIPLRLVGDIPAERASLLVLKNLDHITVEALPKDLIDVVEVDASALGEVGNKLHVSDIRLPSTITIKNEAEQVIATVEMPKDQIAEADAALAEQQAAEGTAAEGEEGAGETAEEGEAAPESGSSEQSSDEEAKE
ncbi:MAG TPA: 50S ribosomal protein L25 [Candidatus Saccharimonadales bacterium]|nr:50S ribosomal protein L25 [Candidatus Saccharimonadales bacterium]